MMAKRLYIYCDESVLNGSRYKDFYGGLLVEADKAKAISDSFETVKTEIGTSELKWQKITVRNYEQYVKLVRLIFSYISKNELKIRIFFSKTRQNYVKYDQYQRERKYHLLYFQFLKHAFGLQYHDINDAVSLEIFLDTMPDSKKNNEEFKRYLLSLQNLGTWRNKRITIFPDDIKEVDSKKHVLMQALDIVLGAIAWKLNNGHKYISPGQTKRGKKTKAKEKVYEAIKQEVLSFHPYFNFGLGTGDQGDIANRWHFRYSHWLFKPKENKKSPR